MKIACAHPGKLGDALYSLSTIKKLCEVHSCTADFYTTTYCVPLKRLFERQSYINNFYMSPNYILKDFGCGAQPWYVPIDATQYDKVYQLGFRHYPDKPLHKFIANSVGIDVDKIEYEYDDFETLEEPYIVIAPRGKTTFSNLFKDIVKISPCESVIIGGYGDYIGRGFDATGIDMLETLTWIAKSKGFIGLMSSQLALANGFNIPKVAPHDGKSWHMNHVIYSPTNFYPVNPTADEVLSCIP